MSSYFYAFADDWWLINRWIKTKWCILMLCNLKSIYYIISLRYLDDWIFCQNHQNLPDCCLIQLFNLCSSYGGFRSHRATPKSSILIFLMGFSIVNHPILGSHKYIFYETPHVFSIVLPWFFPGSVSVIPWSHGLTRSRHALVACWEIRCELLQGAVISTGRGPASSTFTVTFRQKFTMKSGGKMINIMVVMMIY